MTFPSIRPATLVVHDRVMTTGSAPPCAGNVLLPKADRGDLN